MKQFLISKDKSNDNSRTALMAFATVALLVAFVVPGSVHGQDLSLSASTWTFFAGADSYRPAGPGAYAELGATLGLTPRLETNLGLIGEVAPAPAGTLFLNAAASYSILGPRYIGKDKPTAIYSMLLTAGVLDGFHPMWQAAPTGSEPSFSAHSTHVYLRLTPFGVGSLYYGRRDRALGFGVQYDISKTTWSVFANFLAADFHITDLWR